MSVMLRILRRCVIDSGMCRELLRSVLVLHQSLSNKNLQIEVPYTTSVSRGFCAVKPSVHSLLDLVFRSSLFASISMPQLFLRLSSLFSLVKENYILVNVRIPSKSSMQFQG